MRRIDVMMSDGHQWDECWTVDKWRVWGGGGVAGSVMGVEMVTVGSL